MTSQRRCYARDLQKHACIFHNVWFATSRFGTSLVNFGFIMYQNQIINVIMIGHSDTSMHSALRASCIDWSSWPSCLRCHNARYIMLKSLIKTCIRIRVRIMLIFSVRCVTRYRIQQSIGQLTPYSSEVWNLKPVDFFPLWEVVYGIVHSTMLVFKDQTEYHKNWNDIKQLQ